MKTQQRHSSAVTAPRTRHLGLSVALALVLAGSATTQTLAAAQAPGGGGPGGPGGGGPGGPGGGFGGRGFGRGPGGGGGRMGQSPLQSNPLGLLQRAEVQTHLRLSVNQKQQLTDLQASSRDLMRERMGQAFQGQDRESLRNLTPEQRRERMEALRPQMEAARTAFEGEMNDKVKAILTPEQAQRLRQLDLQRRGILSLADPKVAEEIKLSPEHRTQIAQIVSDWQQTTQRTMREAFEAARQSGQLPDLESRLSPTRQKLDRDKKAAEAKVEAVLSPEERAAWQAATGESFTFRADPPRQQQRPNGAPGGGPGGFRRAGVGGGGF